MALKLTKETRAKVEAYAIANDIRRFDLLVEDLDNELSKNWAPLNFEEGLTKYQKDPFDELEFVVVAVDRADEANLGPAANIITSAKAMGIKVLLVAHELSPIALHQLMRLGADDFAPYPLPEGALVDSLERLREMPSNPEDTKEKSGRNRRGMILPVYGIAGGVGASTFAVLDMPRREAIYDLLSDASNVDSDSLSQALSSFKTRLAVLTSPLDALPLDIVGPDDMEKLLRTAAMSYDFVVVDMPSTLVGWSDRVLQISEAMFAVLEVDMRSAQNALRFLRTLKAEDLPHEKIQYALNRAPGFTDMSGKGRIKRLAESLGIEINILLPDGGKAVTNSNDQGLPLSETAAKNALRKEIRRIATSLVDMAAEQKAAVA